MNVIADFLNGCLSVMKVTSAPMLYRYPYRTSAEGLRADWSRIASDIESLMGKLEAEADDGR